MKILGPNQGSLMIPQGEIHCSVSLQIAATAVPRFPLECFGTVYVFVVIAMIFRLRAKGKLLEIGPSILMFQLSDEATATSLRAQLRSFLLIYEKLFSMI